MKQFYIVYFMLLTFGFLQAQIVNIPDPNFKNALLNTNCVDTDGIGGFDADADLNNDGEIQVSEAEAIISLNISNQNVASLVGISVFSNIENLYFNDNIIGGALDLSNLSSLIELECSSNQLTSLDVSNLSSLLYLQLTGNNLQSIDISGSTNLENFLAHENQFTSLNFQGFPNLITVQCGNNQLVDLGLDGLNDLLYLSCYNNSITTLDVSDSPSLIDLNCANNLIDNLNITNLNSLTAMDVSNNNIGQLDLGLITQIDALRCQNNQIQSLDVSNQTDLIVLECQNNVLTDLIIGSLPNIQSINCSNNQLSELELIDLPSLVTLKSSLNQLTDLDVSGALNLTEVRCSSNNFTNLDFSVLTYLETIECTDNQLEFLILKNGNVEDNIDFDNNPNIIYVCSDDEQFSSIQTLLNTYNYTNCVLNAYCSFVPGGAYYTISGETRFDLNANGCDSSDELYPFIKVNLTTDTGVSTFISNADGFYSIPLQTGNYTLAPILENFDYFTISPNTVSLDISDLDLNQDFCIVADGEKRDLEIVLIPLSDARPGFDSDYKLSYKNKGNLPISGSVSLNFQDDIMDLLNSNPAVDVQDVNALTWNYTNLLPFETREIMFTMNLNTPTDPDFPLNGGDILEYTSTINPNNTDESPEDNTFTLHQTVVNSFDPNDKRCLEGETIAADMVGRYVHYMVRFENTGTANAINVVVKDDIDTSKFDISTLIPLNASHDFVTRIQNTNEVEFIFENINLPFDDANNDGYVVFKIKTLETLTVGDTFSNTAEIYFDFNFPIITNEYITTIEDSLSVDEFDLNPNVKLYPNPVSDVLQITSETSINSATIYDVNGRVLQTIVFLGNETERTIAVNQLSKGVYFVKLASEHGVLTHKVIKE